MLKLLNPKFIATSVVMTLLFTISAAAQGGALETLQSQWASITYETPKDQRQEALSDLAENARSAAAADPDNVELLIWQGIIVSSLAGEKGGLGALGLAKEARASLEAALDRSPDALQGSAYTSLGTLYHKVPGWPIGFGSDKKARKLLQQALAINPDGIDSNYFMGAFLYDEGDYEAARAHLETALRAPDRPGRTIADQGRRDEIQQLLAEVAGKDGSR